MITREELAEAVRTWLKSSPTARDAANWLLDRAELDGQIPKRPTFDVDAPWRDAIASFFSSAYVRLSHRSSKLTLRFDDWEQEKLGESGVLLAVLAETCGRSLTNRRQARKNREQQLVGILRRYHDEFGLPGFVAHKELVKLRDRQGRFWHRSARWDAVQIERELVRYFKLLQYIDKLRNEAGRIERIVHVSRAVAGDTHWLRPRNRVWRDLADDILAFDAELAPRVTGNDATETRSRALADMGIVENLTSVTVLLFGHFGLARKSATFYWPIEAAKQGLPIWLSALHLDGAEFVSVCPIKQVVSIENETSFMDRIEEVSNEPGTLLVYTEGNANRAVIALLRLIARSCPDAKFYHEGDLDLPGVRILASLVARSHLNVHPKNMDVQTHAQYAAAAIALSDEEHAELLHELEKGNLVHCRDLLRRIAETRTRIEQEAITANSIL